MNQQTTTSRGWPSRRSPGQSTKKGRAHPLFLLLQSCLSNWSLVFSVLPYNLNWMRKSFEWFGAFLEKNPITLFDIGARGGSPGELEPLQQYIRYVGFDADPAAARALNESPSNQFFEFSVYPFLVADRDGLQPFHLYERPGDSSQLLPDSDFVDVFSPGLRVAQTISVDGIRLDTFCANNPHLSPDIIKLDTQGTELNILECAGSALDSTLLIECEVEFTNIYANQKLFHHVCAFLYGKGFTLLFLNRVFLNRRRFGYAARGQMVFGDALFGRDTKSAAQLSTVQKAKYSALLINYGLHDIAYDLFLADPDMQRISPELGAFFLASIQRNHLWSRIKRGMLMQVDKILALILYLRKTNQLSTDSDRAWPSR